jgi:hypothetical protein
MHLIADFMFGSDEDLSGIFVFERNGILAGVEVYGLAGDAPKSLPSPESLRPFNTTALSGVWRTGPARAFGGEIVGLVILYDE